MEDLPEPVWPTRATICGSDGERNVVEDGGAGVVGEGEVAGFDVAFKAGHMDGGGGVDEVRLAVEEGEDAFGYGHGVEGEDVVVA